MVLSGSRSVSVVLCCSVALVGSQCSRRFSIVLSGSGRFSMSAAIDYHRYLD